ncbi:hypothetical protein LZ30DRAFT_135125 [Colletotrichum cereale]|nr:hypothetical protein LZ30DRAFT_135125 [Colletotrichum cereale]
MLGITAVLLPCLALFCHVCHSLWSHSVEATRSRTPNLGMSISFLSHGCEAAILNSFTKRAALRLAEAWRRRRRGFFMKNEVIHEEQDEATTPEESFSIGPFTNSHHRALGMKFSRCNERKRECLLTYWLGSALPPRSVSRVRTLRFTAVDNRHFRMDPRRETLGFLVTISRSSIKLTQGT